MSQQPGLDRLTRSEPGDATKGVTIEATATGEPERSWMVMDHPFLSLPGLSLSLPNELNQPLAPLQLASNGNDLSINRNRRQWLQSCIIRLLSLTNFRH